MCETYMDLEADQNFLPVQHGVDGPDAAIGSGGELLFSKVRKAKKERGSRSLFSRNDRRWTVGCRR